MNKPKTMNTDTSWANSPIHQMIQNFESPTPETDASERDIDEIPTFSFVSSNFARKLERERDEIALRWERTNDSLIAERALADRLALALNMTRWDSPVTCKKAFDAWMEERGLNQLQQPKTND